MRILYIEDNPGDVALVRQCLADQLPNIVFESVTTLAAAQERLTEANQEQPIYDLLLLDLRLPDGDGLQLVRHVRERRLPMAIIVLTRDGNEEIAVTTLKSGANDYVAQQNGYLDQLPALCAAAVTHSQASTIHTGRILRVLYAEHHSADIDLTSRHFARYAPHIQMEIVHNAADVLARLAQATTRLRYDILLLDFQLPGTNALELFAEIKARKWNSVPTVFVTGQGDETTAVQALRLGAVDYLVKNPGYLYQLPRTLENAHTQALLLRERAALLESEQRYRTLFDRVPVAIYTKDLTGLYTSANAMAVTAMGMDPRGLRDREVFSPHQAEQFVEADRQVIDSGKEILSEDRWADVNPQDERIFLTRKAPVLDVHGTITGVMGISLEISERVRAEAAQRDHERRLIQLAEHIDQMFFLQEMATSQILYVNSAFEKLSGYACAELYAYPALLEEIIVPEDRVRVLAALTAAMGGVATDVEYRAQRRDGAIRWFASRLFPVYDEEGRLYRVAGLMSDISERRRQEDLLLQQDRLAAVGQMAAGIAHDFNNILAIIMLYTQMLQIAVTSPVHQRHLATIHQQANHAANLVQQILDFSRRSALERVAMDLRPFMRELVRLWQRMLPESIRTEFQTEDKEFLVIADPARLQQAFLNIAINARDAMPQGGTLTVSLKDLVLSLTDPPPVPGMTAQAWVVIHLQDTGSGISPDILPHIFDPFFTTKDPGQGTGLGLAQVYGIVRQLDGYVQVASAAGQGTSFTIYLPATVAPAAQNQDIATSAPLARSGETVLVVEDEETLRSAIEEMLQSLGYEVLLAENGRHALEIFGAHQDQIVLVLSDLVMPEMGGLELAAKLSQEFGARLPGLRVLLITGYPLGKADTLQHETWFAGWLQKPFTREALAQGVSAALADA